MKTKNLIVLAALAAVLGAAAYLLSDGSKSVAPKLNGKTVLPGLDVSKVASIEAGALKLVSSDKGWQIASYHDYPADRAKITENLLKLTELKVGQMARGRKLASVTTIALKDAAGSKVAELKLGERHPKYGHGRYAEVEGETVLVSDTLEAFDGDPKRWLETKIVDDPWVSFDDIADAKLTEAEFGFKTGVVAKVTIAGDTNRVMTIGNFVEGKRNRYVKLDGSKWVYQVPEYSVEKLLPKPEPKKEAKPDAPKKSEVKKPEVKKTEPNKAAPKKVEAKK